MMNHILAARETIRRGNHELTEASLEAILALTSISEDLLSTPEYDQPEYLLNCDSSGLPVSVSAPLVDAIASMQIPGQHSWIKIVDDQILMLRWLAHFVGLRHRAIHMFIDIVGLPDLTLVQIRSLSKYNQPGQFDMPVAGHVDATDTPLETATKEMSEELALPNDEKFRNINEICTSNIAIPDFQPNYQEVEHTTLYRAAIQHEALASIHLQRDEVGGLILFDKSELEKWIETRPHQVGGGLADSWPRYRAT